MRDIKNGLKAAFCIFALAIVGSMGYTDEVNQGKRNCESATYTHDNPTICNNQEEVKK